MAQMDAYLLVICYVFHSHQWNIKGFFFSSTCGLRQDDPLLPMLFSLVAKSLTQLFLVAQSHNFLYGFLVKDGGMPVPFMQNADDTITIIDDDLEMANNLRGLLQFDATTRLQLNYKKTKFFEVNQTSHWGQVIEKGGYIPGHLPNVYLGLPLASRYKDRVVWQEFVDDFRRSLRLGKGDM